MVDDERRDEEETESRRPRVVDKRVSARDAGAGDAPAADRAPRSQRQEEAPPPDATPRAEPSRVWTPEAEADAERIAEELARVPARDWIANSAVTLANVAATKLQRDQLEDASLAIDALASLVEAVAVKLPELGSPLRQTLAQLQLAYAEASRRGPAAPPAP